MQFNYRKKKNSRRMDALEVKVYFLLHYTVQRFIINTFVFLVVFSAATCDVSQCSVIIYRDCPAADSCGSANGKSCAYLPGGRSEATGCGSNPCSPVVGNGNWQSICGGIDAIEVSGPCTAQLARQSGGTSPYSKIYQSGFHGIWRTYENGVHLGDNAASVRMQCVVRKFLSSGYTITCSC